MPVRNVRLLPFRWKARAYSNQANTESTRAKPANRAPPVWMTKAASAMPTTPVMILVNNETAPILFIGQAAKAAVAPGKVDERVDEAGGREVRPVDIGEVELRIGRLPEQEVREALVAARADDEVDGRVASRVELLIDGLGVDVLGGNLPCRRLARKRLRRADELILAAVVGCDVEADACVGRFQFSVEKA